MILSDPGSGAVFTFDDVAMVEATIRIINHCKPCSECEDFVKVYH